MSAQQLLVAARLRVRQSEVVRRLSHGHRMSIEEHYQAYADAQSHGKSDAAHRFLCAARKSLNFREHPQDFEWLVAALEHSEKRWFVAAIFRTASLPKRLFDPMMRAAIREPDISRQKFFVEPCVATFGSAPVIEALSHYIHNGTPEEAEAADRAMYWGRYRRSKRGQKGADIS